MIIFPYNIELHDHISLHNVIQNKGFKLVSVSLYSLVQPNATEQSLKEK